MGGTATVMSIPHGKEGVQQMIFGGQPTPALAAECRQVVSAKYRIDDWLDAGHRLLLRFPWREDAIKSDIDGWLEDIAQNPALDDKLWLAKRYPDIDKVEAPSRFSVPGFGSWEPGPYALLPVDFIEHVLPGVRMRTDEAPERVLRDVDSSLVIGGTYGRYDLEPASLEKLDRINEETKQSWNPEATALYFKVGSLPLYIAIEGKNRVRAFQLKGKPIWAVIGSVIF